MGRLLHVDRRSLGAALHLQLLEDADEIVFDRVFTQAELSAGLLVGHAFRDKGEDAAFLSGEDGQVRTALCGVAAAEQPQHTRGGVWIENGTAGGDILERLHEARGIDFLLQVAVGAGGHGVVHEIVVCVCSQHHDAGVRKVFEDLPAGVETAAVGQADVEQDYARFQGGADADSLSYCACFAHHLHRRIRRRAVQDGFYAAPNEFAVIDENDADGRARRVRHDG